MARIPPPEIIAAAKAAHKIWPTIPPSVDIAQWEIESGWGEHMPAGSNNPFGIKALKGQPSVTAMTTEYVGGRFIRVPQPFRKYASLSEAFIDHSRLLATAAPYAAARARLPDVRAFVVEMAKRYATDPGYAGKILGQIDAGNLTQYDR